MEKIDYEGNSQVLKALSHPLRLKILEYLVQGKGCINDVSNTLGIPQSITSQYLRILRNAGIVYFQKSGSKAYYLVNNELAQGIISILQKGELSNFILKH
jgi:DNA-binding transcriptional ArsR family regulator